MEIPGKPPLVALQAHNYFKDDSQTVSSLPSSGKKVEDDTVAISVHAGKIKNAVRVLQNMPDVREDKVAAMKRRIASGNYRIAGDKIASNLIGESLENNGILNGIDGDRN